jgi:hypothetical protein
MSKVEPMDVPKIHSFDNSLDSPDEHELLLSTSSKIVDLSSFHPQFQVLQNLQTYFLDRVDPITKILHFPTFWTSLSNGIANPKDIPKSLESLIFVFYFVTVSSLDIDECLSLFGEQRSIVSARYKFASHQALMNARFLKSSNLTTLQAFSLFLVRNRLFVVASTNFVDWHQGPPRRCAVCHVRRCREACTENGSPPGRHITRSSNF